MIYVMSKQMYWHNRVNSENRNCFFSDKDFVDYINRSFGLTETITDIRIEG